jgi:hypothetical protein
MKGEKLMDESLKNELTRIHDELALAKPGSKEYAELLRQLKTLMEVINARPTRQTAFWKFLDSPGGPLLASNLFLGSGILLQERTGLITSKIFGWIRSR